MHNLACIIMIIISLFWWAAPRQSAKAGSIEIGRQRHKAFGEEAMCFMKQLHRPKIEIVRAARGDQQQSKLETGCVEMLLQRGEGVYRQEAAKKATHP